MKSYVHVDYTTGSHHRLRYQYARHDGEGTALCVRPTIWHHKMKLRGPIECPSQLTNTSYIQVVRTDLWFCFRISSEVEQMLHILHFYCYKPHSKFLMTCIVAVVTRTYKRPTSRLITNSKTSMSLIKCN